MAAPAAGLAARSSGLRRSGGGSFVEAADCSVGHGRALHSNSGGSPVALMARVAWLMLTRPCGPGREHPSGRAPATRDGAVAGAPVPRAASTGRDGPGPEPGVVDLVQQDHDVAPRQFGSKLLQTWGANTSVVCQQPPSGLKNGLICRSSSRFGNDPSCCERDRLEATPKL